MALALLVVNACAKPRPTGDPGGAAPVGAAAPGGAPGLPGAAGAPATTGDMQRLYRNMGLVAGAATLPFVASVSFLPSPTPDSTLVLLSLSLPSRALGFGREGERYVAGYVARVELRRGPTVVRTIEANETVRVPTFRETARTDESIIWQQFIRVAPGRYSMSVAIRDEGGLRNAAEDVTLDVPPMRIGALASPVAVYEAIPRQSADSLPRLLARPRSTVIFGQDSVLPIYIDAVGANAPARVDVRVVGEGDLVSWTNSIELQPRGNARSTTITIPVTRMSVGLNTVQMAIPGTPDTVRTRVLVTLGDDLPIANFEEMLSYLRYFTTADRLKPLRDAAPLQRAEVWATFLRETPRLNTRGSGITLDGFAPPTRASGMMRKSAGSRIVASPSWRSAIPTTSWTPASSIQMRASASRSGNIVSCACSSSSSTRPASAAGVSARRVAQISTTRFVARWHSASSNRLMLVGDVDG